MAWHEIVGNLFKYLLDLLTILKWPLFLALILFKAEKVKEIIAGFKDMNVDMELGGQKFKIDSAKIRNTLERNLKDLTLKTNKSKPFPYASHEEYENVVQIVRAMEFLGNPNDKIENLSVLKCMGGYYFIVRNYNKALEFYSLAEKQVKKISNLSEEVDVYTNLGYTYYAQKKYENADLYFKKAKFIDKSSAWADYGRYLCHRDSGDLEENYRTYYDNAFTLFNEQIVSNHLNYLGHFGLAMVYWGKKEYQEALKYFKKVTKIEPNYDIAYYNIAILIVKINPNDTNEAIENLRKAINLNPEFANWVKKDAFEDDDLESFREDKCFKCIVMKNSNQ